MKTYRKTWLVKTGLPLAILAPVIFYGYAEKEPVDTASMLDVSVSIRTISHVSTDKYGDSVWAPGSGSGFLVSSATCEVWTNHHVIEDAAVIEVFPRDWKKAHGIIAKLVNSTPHTDIAILQMESCEGIPAARFGSLLRARVGDETYVVGNPFGKNPDSVSRGIISHGSRYLSGPIPYLQTDAAVNPGNSGGALFNRDGAVIGLTTAIAATSSGNNVGISYALPINTVLDEIAALRNGPPSWGDAGINNIIASLTAEEAAIFQVPDGYGGVNITRTPEDGPSADKLLARDVVYKIGDEAVINPAQVKRLIGHKKPNQVIDFSLIRNGSPQVVSVTLADGWSQHQKPDHEAEDYSGLLGMGVEMWSDRKGERGQFKSPVITKIFGLGPAHLGYITSSQSLLGRRGAVMAPVQIIVNTVTGVVIEGEYMPVGDVSTLDRFADEAYDNKLPLLLEIETWHRDPNYFFMPLEYNTTAFYKIIPTPRDEVVYEFSKSPASLRGEDFEIEVLYRS
jgi:S1-C subfamily serine protease